MDKEEIILHLEKILNPQRFSHTINVANCAVSLAQIHGEDTEKAYLAGLLHDCAKCYSADELSEKIKSYGIKLDDTSKKSPQLWHSYVGACEAKSIYGVCDDDILNAVYYHTIGRQNMSKLEKIIYLADAIEPSRSYSGVEELRKLSKISLDEAVLEYTKRSIEFIRSKGALVHPNAYAITGDKNEQ